MIMTELRRRMIEDSGPFSVRERFAWLRSLEAARTEPVSRSGPIPSGDREHRELPGSALNGIRRDERE